MLWYKIDFIIGIIIGFLIMCVPMFITGKLYHTSNALGALLVSEFIMWTLSLIIGLLVIYHSFKVFSKAKNNNERKQ